MVKPDATPASRDRDTEQRILDAAHAVFVRRGTAGARMQEIADEAGVNKALLHYYFRSKDRLAEAVFAHVARGIFVPLASTLASELPLEEKVMRLVELEHEQLTRSPFLPGYFVSEMNHYPDRLPQLVAAATGMPPGQVAERVLAPLRRQIAERVAAGTMREIPAEQFLISLISLCIFPFAARPMVCLILGLDADGFTSFMETRRRELGAFFLQAVRP